MERPCYNWQLILSAVLLLSLHFSVYANEQAESESDIRFALQYYPPFIIEDQTHPGVLIDIFNAFSQHSGLSVTYLYSPEKRSSAEIEKGNVDVRMESESWYSGTQKMCWSEALYTIDDVYITHRSEPTFTIDSLETWLFLGRFGYAYPALDPLVIAQRLQRQDFYSEYDILQALSGAANKEKAFSVIGEPTLLWLQKLHPAFTQSIVVHEVSDSAPLQLQFSLSASELCDAFNAFFSSFKKTEQYKKILLRYGLSVQE
ncbi:substrate-binding periplasmic protein [Pseudoalteromonas sp. T1lg65]|uniref:substrate-binding periplasmic protein n=1 Tax=Pseudoalteromonas sp. T1lg65 TaxID=2077101 RepID=UPI003F78B935